MSKNIKLSNWELYDFKKYNKLCNYFNKQLDEHLHTAGCVNSGDTLEIEYFKLRDFVKMFYDMTDTYKRAKKIRTLVELM